MNIRKMVTYNNLRKQFTPEELAFADALYAASDTERELLVESLQPTKGSGKKKPAEAVKRKIEKCDACNYTRRAAAHKDESADGYHEFISTQTAQNISRISRRGLPATPPVTRALPDRCVEALPNGAGVCGLSADDVLHGDSSYGNY